MFQTSSCTGVRGERLRVLPQYVQCESARRASATGAPYPQARPTPRTLSARARGCTPLENGVMTVMTISERRVMTIP